MNDARRATLEEQVRHALNSASAENESNTPDFILAKYLLACLDAHTHATREREAWYGVMHAPGAANLPGPAIITDSPLKAIADDLRAGTFRGVVPLDADEKVSGKWTGPGWYPTNRGRWARVVESGDPNVLSIRSVAEIRDTKPEGA